MVYGKIFDSNQVNALQIRERLLYIALIIFADDKGYFRADGWYWKRHVFYEDRGISVAVVQKMIKRIEDGGLIVLYPTQDGPCGSHPNWHRYQILRKDRCRPSDILARIDAESLSFVSHPGAEGKEDKGDKKNEEKNQAIVGGSYLDSPQWMRVGDLTKIIGNRATKID